MNKKKRIFIWGLCLAVCAAAFLGYCFLKMDMKPEATMDISAYIPAEFPTDFPVEQIHPEGYLHFSVDDSNSIFEDLTNNRRRYKSIFDQPLLGFFKQLHDRYGVVVSFYVFYSWGLEEGHFALSDATDHYAAEFSANADWLRFGFHAIDAASYEKLNPDTLTAYYEKTVNELVRITGSEACIDTFLRLDRYTADEACVAALRDAGVTGLLIAVEGDGRTTCYDLTTEEYTLAHQEDWYVRNGTPYTPTDMRLEVLESDEEFFDGAAQMIREPRMVAFTHEWILEDTNVQKYMTWLAEFAYEQQIPFRFPEDQLGG